ncbi:thioredoxin domain-containing protein [Brevibacterium jeotgali]|uniref:Spermatogenesis-associated protein 20-like TRX domain-containing protein n=1 Tax=Brevibacterium jeotgali TaxID=1262550 RepID=A0A2H1L3U9_9MICO|nr:DUF255 domain-containing protein [Brevibacterium jeotgali]TWC01827.1 hypothetical protein FB108_0483 [Brevibacterium jeotgali]SMY11574.1 hypothetical protein BJEO58_01159 [Brevibacterium jeotgali]
MTNLLSSSTSPYLRAHADNPVEWRPWGRAAFDEARDRDVPVLVSIGYSTCHWCHVMAAESFSDPEVGRLLGESVVAIKLDREELPAVDAFYMDALLAMRGQGGWPLNVFTTPDARPFFAGTYFPSEPSGGMPGFRQVVTTIARTWANDRERAESIASQLAASLVRLPDLSRGLPAGGPVPEVDDDSLTAAAENLLSAEDQRWGGFGSSPKFPPTLSLIQLLRRHDRSYAPEVPAGPELAAVRRTFAGISSGGMRDQVDGGIARYSVDARWHIPHFEKMLFDNALYLRAATRWYATERGRGDSSRYTALAAREVHDTARFLLDRLELPGGGFASGLDADSADDDGNRTEGAYYLEAGGAVPEPFVALGPVDAAAPGRPFAVGFPAIADWVHGGEEPGSGGSAADIAGADSAGAESAGGETVGADPAIADTAGAESAEAGSAGADPADPAGPACADSAADAVTGGADAPWATAAAREARQRVAERRAGRALPNRDEKLVTEWNGLAIVALMEAGRVFEVDEWMAAATRAFEVLSAANQGDSPLRSSTEGEGGPGAAGLSDAAQTAVAAHAVGEDEAFATALSDALGFVVFPQQDREDDGNPAGASAAVGEQPAVRSGGRWEGASLLDAHGDGIVPARGSDPLDGSAPSGRSALIEALRLAVGDSHADSVPRILGPDGREVSADELTDLRRRLLASTLPALQQATRALGWLLAEAELDAAQ